MRIIILAIYMALFVVACGGSSTPSTTKESTNEPKEQTKIGVFIDAPVKGLAYTSLPSGKKGTTNEKGEFEYIDGDTVSFNMGSIELGSAAPDKEKTVKVTQLKEAILVAQLLQVLDTDADEDKIDVSDIVIPEVIEKAIEKKLKGTDGNTADNEDSTENNNIISEEQFTAIKLKNPTKLTLQQRTKVVPKEKVIEHVEQQIGKKGLGFSTLELENQFLIESQILNSMDGVIFSFSDASSPVSQIDIKGDDDISVLEDIPWEIDKQGKLAIDEGDEKCTVSKLAENELIDVSVTCGSDEKKNEKEDKPFKFLSNFIKPQPLSANSFSGKSFKVSEEATITFRNDGTFNCNGTEICSYEDHPSYKNTVLIIDDSEETKRHTLVLLAEGSITKGKFVFIESMKKNKTTSVEVYAVADGTLKNLFDTKNQDTNKGEDKDNSKDNNSNDKKDSDENTNNDKENSDNNSDAKNSPEASTPKPSYIPFKQEMISGKTFYVLGAEQDDQEMTMVLGANKGQVWFSLTDSNTSPDVTFDFLINDEGYIIFSNTNEKGVISDDTPVAGLLSESNNALTTCWGGNSVSDISDFCKDDDIKTWYKIKEEAETALKLKTRRDDDKNSPETDKPKPTYIPFTQEMISGKTLYNVFTGQEDEDNDGSKTDSIAITISVDKSNSGIGAFGLHDKITTPEANFNSSINDKGFWVLSYPNGDKDVYGLIKENDTLLMVCKVSSQSNDLCDENRYEYFYKDKEDTKLLLEALDREDYDRQNPTYIPFTQEMISGKTLYNVYNDWRDEEWKARTLIFDESNRGMGKPGIHKAITNPPSTFSYSINDEGFVSLSYDPEGWHEFGLIKVEDDYFKVCNVSGQSNNLCDESSYEYFYRTPEAAEAAEAALKAHESENSDNNSDSKDSDEAGTPKPSYIPFKQEMISGKTFYVLGEEQDDQEMTMVLGANKGQVWFSLTDSNTSPDVTFDFLINDEGYIIFSNTNEKGVISDDTPVAGLLSESNNALTTCWGGNSVSDISDFCKDNDIKTWYKIKEEAEAAIKERKDNDTDENSDSKDNPNAGIPNPTYSPFTEKIVAGKTFYVPGVEKDDNFSISFGANKKGKVWLSLAENTTPPDMIFDYLIDTEGYVVFFNVKEKGVDSEYAPAMGLLIENNHALIVCWSNYSLNDIRDVCENDDKMIMYKTKDAAQAEIRADDEYFDDHSDHVDNPNLDSKNPDFIRFTQEMISGKTIFYVSSNGKGTYQFDPSGTGKLQYGGYHETINSPDLTFDWDISEQGNLIFSKVFFGSASVSNQVYSLSKKETSSLEICLSASNGSSGDEEYCSEEAWFYNKEDAEEASKE